MKAARDQANDSEIDGGVDKMAQEKRMQMMEGDSDLVSSCLAFSGMEMLCTVICLVNQCRILFFDQQNEKSSKPLRENLRRSSDHPI
jgi:hypothetical protein